MKRMAPTTPAPGRFALVLGVLITGIFVPAAAAQQFRANVDSWSPDIVQPGEPVTVVLTLHADPAPRTKARTNGRREVAVVIRKNGQMRRFATKPLGSGRYRTKIVFPAAGRWTVLVRFRAAANSSAGEIPLGKGATCVGDCGASRAMRNPSANGHGWLAIALGIGGGVLLAAVVLRRRMVLRARAGTAAE